MKPGKSRATFRKLKDTNRDIHNDAPFRVNHDISNTLVARLDNSPYYPKHIPDIILECFADAVSAEGLFR